MHVINYKQAVSLNRFVLTTPTRPYMSLLELPALGKMLFIIINIWLKLCRIIICILYIITLFSVLVILTYFILFIYAFNSQTLSNITEPNKWAAPLENF